MTLPDNCDVCGFPLMPWDDTEDTPCSNPRCGATVRPWEDLTPEQARRRMALIARREAINEARVVRVREDVL